MLTINNNSDSHWIQGFDERQTNLIHNCQAYATNRPGGLPGHQLMLIIANMAHALDTYELLNKQQASIIKEHNLIISSESHT